MSRLEVFLDLHKHIVYHPDVVPYVAYKGDIHMKKTLFGAKVVPGPIGVSWDIEEPEKDLVKHTLKKSHAKVKRGDIFVFRETPDGYEVIPGFGIVLSNLYGHDWTIEELERILKHDNIRGVIWDAPVGTVYYEKTDAFGS